MPGILVVDDDEAVRESARLVLEDAGYVVDEAPNGAVALDTLRACREPMVVLLDLVMPQLSGAELLRRVRQEALLARHTFILWSASRVPVPADLLREVDVLTLPKPSDIEELIRVVGEAAGRVDAGHNA